MVLCFEEDAGIVVGVSVIEVEPFKAAKVVADVVEKVQFETGLGGEVVGA